MRTEGDEVQDAVQNQVNEVKRKVMARLHEAVSRAASSQTPADGGDDRMGDAGEPAVDFTKAAMVQEIEAEFDSIVVAAAASLPMQSP